MARTSKKRSLNWIRSPPGLNFFSPSRSGELIILREIFFDVCAKLPEWIEIVNRVQSEYPKMKTTLTKMHETHIKISNIQWRTDIL
uniref:Uncharacterized protein n=1 Tax=Arundo donax TaxID=35708 RepID=A0A0A9CHY9_ARUDO